MRLEVNDLHVRYGRVHAVRGVSLAVEAGELADASEARRLANEPVDVVVPDERARDPCAAQAEEHKAGERKEPVAGDEHEDGAQRPEQRGDLRGVRVLHRA